MTTPSQTIVAGIDIGKSGLDAHLEPGGQARHFANTKAGRRARRFAEAIGRLAKNDRVDASMLACYGLLSDLAGTPPKAPILHRLNDLIAIRRKHIAQRAAQLKLHSQLDAGTAAELGDPLIQLFDELIGKADTALQACIASDPELARRAAIIRSIPGFGPANAASLCADMPELGSINRRQAAALIGIAPYDHDSGKQHKVAMVAVMRKLITLANALLRADREWQPAPPAREAVS